jgi:hypothetical protein
MTWSQVQFNFCSSLDDTLLIPTTWNTDMPIKYFFKEKRNVERLNPVTSQKKWSATSQKKTLQHLRHPLYATKYIIKRGPDLGHISLVGPMCFHLIVYIPLRRISRRSICTVARGFYANNCVSMYAWPVFTKPTGPIRHRKRKSIRLCMRVREMFSFLNTARFHCTPIYLLELVYLQCAIWPH